MRWHAIFMAAVVVSSMALVGATGTGIAAEDDAEIEIEDIDVHVDDVSPGETITVIANIDNEEWESQRFFLGLSVRGPHGTLYDNDDSTGRVVELNGNTEENFELTFRVPENAPEGEYDVIVATWAETHRDFLYTRLDEDTDYEAFSVEDGYDTDRETGTNEDDDGWSTSDSDEIDNKEYIAPICGNDLDVRITTSTGNDGEKAVTAHISWTDDWFSKEFGEAFWDARDCAWELTEYVERHEDVQVTETTMEISIELLGHMGLWIPEETLEWGGYVSVPYYGWYYWPGLQKNVHDMNPADIVLTGNKRDSTN